MYRYFLKQMGLKKKQSPGLSPLCWSVFKNGVLMISQSEEWSCSEVCFSVNNVFLMLEVAVQIKIVQIKVHLRGLYRYYKGHLIITQPTLWRRASEEVSRSFSNQYLIKQMSFLLVIVNMQPRQSYKLHPVEPWCAPQVEQLRLHHQHVSAEVTL